MIYMRISKTYTVDEAIVTDVETEARQNGVSASEVVNTLLQRGLRARRFARIAARHNEHLDPAYLDAALAEREQSRTA
jgi:hypothetical protein